jgi:hypothetical protein
VYTEVWIEIIADNAKPHIGHHNISKINIFCIDKGWKIIIDSQTTNSPDLNVNDLSFFWSLQKKQMLLKQIVRLRSNYKIFKQLYKNN